MNQYDVIIVGGSVAGASTAMLLARRGYHVLLLDKQIFPRDTNSTHFIWPRGFSYLKRWGIADELTTKVPCCREMNLNIEGINLTGSVPIDDLKQRFTHLHGDADYLTDQYMGPRRHFLDHILINNAEKSGAKVHQGCNFEEVIMENNRVIGVRYKNANNTHYKAYAKIVIGADGRYSKVAKQVGAEIIDYRALSTFAYYGYFSGITQPQLDIHKKGRLGTAIYPTMDDTQMVLVYGPNAWWDDFRKNTEQNFYATYDYCDPEMGEKIRAGKREEKFKACGSMSAFKRQLFGQGWVLIGDACSFKDQVSAMGITHAFRDAELLTSHLDQGLSGDIPLYKSLTDYEKVRAFDYDEYFDLVCQVAEMNPYSKEDLKQIYHIQKDQNKINEMISQFGDTKSLSTANPVENQKNTNIIYPEYIHQYDIEKYHYKENIYL